MVFATRKLMREFCCRKSRRQVQIDADVQACGIVATATAARFNLLRKFTLRVREPSPQSRVAKAADCGFGHHFVV